MQQVVEELKKDKLCMLFWDGKIEYELGQPAVLSYEPVGEMGVYSKEYDFSLPYKGNENRFKGLSADLIIKITSIQEESMTSAATRNDNCFYHVSLTVRRDKESLISMRHSLFSDDEPEYCGVESALSLFLGG